MSGAIRTRVPFDEYVGIPAMNISRLKNLRRSPLYYIEQLRAPRSSPALSLGIAAHAAILEPERFKTDFAHWTRRTESGRVAPRAGQHWDLFVRANATKTILTESERSTALAIAASVRAHPGAMKYLSEGEPEVVLEWSGPEGLRKGRLDWLTRDKDGPVLVGVKSTRDCRHRWFSKQTAELDYPLQWAWYYDGFAQITREVARVVEIVVESTPPYDVAVYNINDDVIYAGEVEFLRLLEVLAECTRTNQWPGACPLELDLVLPAYYLGGAGVEGNDPGTEDAA